MPVLTVNSVGNLIAGENYTLTCTATVVEGLTDDALVATSWIDSTGDPVQSNVVQISDVNTTATLEFEPLLLSHGGRYICNVSITISAISTVRRNSEPYDIITQSNTIHVVNNPFVYNACFQSLHQLLKY